MSNHTIEQLNFPFEVERVSTSNLIPQRTEQVFIPYEIGHSTIGS